MQTEEIKSILNDDEKLNLMTKLAFEKFDGNKRGYLTKGDIRVLFEEIASELDTAITDSELDEIFIEIDTNSTNKLYFEEFKRFIRDLLYYLSEKSSVLY